LWLLGGYGARSALPMPRYSIIVTAGPSLDEATHQCVHVNSEKYVPISSGDFVGQVAVRVRDFHGVAPEGCEPIAQSVYFDEAKGMTFSIEASGEFCILQIPRQFS